MNLETMAQLRTPIISAVIGEGGSGAIAIGLADRILMLENAIYSVISPEGAAAILWKDKERVREAAAALNLTAPRLHELGAIDEVVPEPSAERTRIRPRPPPPSRTHSSAIWANSWSYRPTRF